MKNTNINLVSLIVLVVLLTGAVQFMTGCQPTSGDYGVFDLRSDSPDAPAGSLITASLTGKVVDNAKKAGQAGVAVRMFAVDKTLLREMSSVTDGSFLFTEVPAGTYLLEAANGSTQFDTATYTVLVNSDGTILPANISLVVYPKGFSAEMLVDIHGQVTASTTSILENDVDVSLFRVVGGVPEATAMATAKTQAKGLFLFPQQKPGVYQIILSKPSRPGDTYTLIVKNDGMATPDIPLELVLGD